MSEDRHGPSRRTSGETADLGARLEDLGRRWETPNVAFKPYPACHWIHATVDAVAGAATGLVPHNIARIPDVGVPIVFESAASKVAPRTVYYAKFSLPWCVAARVVEGRFDVGALGPRMLELSQAYQLIRAPRSSGSGSS